MGNFKYTYVDYPYLSKTAIKEYQTCKYRFKLRYIDGIEARGNVSMTRGTYLHNVYDKAFTKIDAYELFEMRDLPFYPERLTSSPIYEHILTAVLSVSDPEVYDEDWFKNTIRGFVTFQTLHAASLMKDVYDPDSFKKYFVPKKRELFLVNDEFQMYGTIDAVMYDYNPDKILILDYKNVHSIPAPLFKDKTNNGYSTTLPRTYVMEGNFYVMLHAIVKNGYKVETDSKGKLIFTKNGEPRKLVEDYDYAFAFFPFVRNSRYSYYFARKKPNMLSIRNIVSKMNKIRSETIYERVNTIFVCQRCPYYEKHCRGHLPAVDQFIIDI